MLTLPLSKQAAMQFELNKEYLDGLKQFIRDEDQAGLLEQITNLHEADIAEVIDELKLEEARFLYRSLDEETAAEVLVELEEDVREKLLDELSSKEIAGHIDNLESDDAADVLGELSEEKKEEVIAHIEDEGQVSHIKDLLTHDEGTAGALMAKEMIAVKENWPVSQCVTEIRKLAEEVDNIYAVYVTDEQDKLLGLVPLHSLLLNPADKKVSELLDPEVVSVTTDTKGEDVSKKMHKYDLVVLPVVDEDKHLVGRITIDDVVDFIKEEAGKDYQLASGISESVESKDNILALTRARLPWLLIGMLGGIVGAEVIGIFDIKENIEMAFFIPLIAAMGGNVGVQSSAIIVQGLANHSLGIETMFSRLLKELGVGLLNGIVCAGIVLGASTFLGYTIQLSLTVSTSLLAVIIFAALFGTFVPLTLDRYKIDPAVATGPFITTMNDVFGLLLYFAIGKVMYF